MRQVLNIAYYEVLHIFRNRILFLMVFIVPAAYACLFGVIYASGILQDIPIAVVDMDSSNLSREVRTAFSESPKFQITGNFDTFQELEQGMKNGTIRAGIVIPEGFEEDASLYRGAEVMVVYDASNLIWGYNTRKYAMEVVSKFNVDRAAAYLTGLGMGEEAIKETLDSVSCVFEIWYNPTLSYATFLFVSLTLMIIHQIGLLGSAISVTRDKDHNCWSQYLGSPIPGWKIYIGKCLPYFVTNLFNYALLLLLAKEFIGAKIEGQVSIIFLLGLIYVLIITSIGFFISIHARSSIQVTRYVMLLSTPLFIISGVSWPFTHMPFFINALARATPFAWMAEAFRMVTLKNLGLGYAVRHCAALCIMGVICIAGCWNFSKRKKPCQQHNG